MSTAGKTVLLALLSLGVSGTTTQLHAQGKLLPISLGLTNPNPACTPLQDILVTKTGTCEDKKLSQAEIAVKAAATASAQTTIEFSYSTEPTYYVPPTPTPKQAQIETITPTPNIETRAPENNVPADSANLNSDLIFTLINQHRVEIGKIPFQKDDELCRLAQTRSVELHDELFVNGNLHSGLYNRNLPYWITENAKWGSNEAGTVQWWLNSPIHRAAIEGDYTYSCGACTGSQCSQLFTSYTPKAVATAN
jgi:uncharacterized protein YkwD